MKQTKGTHKPCLPLKINEELCLPSKVHFSLSAFSPVELLSALFWIYNAQYRAKGTSRFFLSRIQEPMVVNDQKRPSLTSQTQQQNDKSSFYGYFTGLEPKNGITL
jgi:hypothetical protein